jgi:hypothetical protein
VWQAAIHGAKTSPVAVMEPDVRARLVLLSIAALAGMAACGRPMSDAAAPDAASPGLADSTQPLPGQPQPNAAGSDLLAQVNDRAPYAGEWAAERGDCGDERKTWTIEPHRMAILPAMRFCAFENVYVNKAVDEGETAWSAGATCLAEGRESHDFLFFRVKDDLREMRVTFNDSRSVQLYRCLAS